MRADPVPDRSTLVAFVAVVLIGGANFVAVRFSNEELDPLFGAAVRFAAAALLLFALAWARGVGVPRGKAAVGALLYGALGFGIAYGCLYFALVEISAGTASVITASVPLFTLALAVVHRQERFSLRGVVGGVLALIGIGILSAGSVGGELPAVYFLAAVAGVVAIAESSVVVKGFPRGHPLMTNALGTSAGAVLLTIGSLAAGESWTVPAGGRTVAALAWLIVVGSVGLFALFLFVIERWTASATVYALTLMPVVAVTLGALIANEAVTPNVFAGAALVIAAVYVGALSGKTSIAATGPPEPHAPPVDAESA